MKNKNVETEQHFTGNLNKKLNNEKRKTNTTRREGDLKEETRETQNGKGDGIGRWKRENERGEDH